MSVAATAVNDAGLSAMATRRITREYHDGHRVAMSWRCGVSRFNQDMATRERSSYLKSLGRVAMALGAETRSWFTA